MDEILIEKTMVIKNVLKKLDITAKKILLVIDEEKLVGTVTDGDIRRWILKNGDLNSQVYNIMNKTPITIKVEQQFQAKNIMIKHGIEAVPVIDSKNRILDVLFLNDDALKKKKNMSLATPVVIMAGGKGTRLYPYTKILPKPLIPIGDISISERIIERFSDMGCRNFYFTVNYKKNMIRAYFDELDKDYEINYIEEGKFLGTAGSLSLLKGKLNETFFLSNCDILVEADYRDILKYHKEKKNVITMVTSLKNYKIPYGVIKLNDEGQVVDTVEKPEYDYLVNTGFYILESEALNDIPEDTFFHITDLIDKYIKEGKKVGTYPISENSWLDMGEIKEMDRMIERLNL
ncbi:nucleotidyltransferase family protein [Clostridium butyricum]|uniref:nucleotidyltransferase family protein n=1 Tax=Clostridium butyricum TaxID=1492 RepID=UPI0013D83C97|nr:nucleotidyltransferase family protein [Clostridium butyricum]MCQ2022248.1 nucleotidyltransferase family protein [Clostridium butyricum]NFB70114.1 nucleotidyltransferase [Clostridium butyricum]NFB89901.1 nucleotidyltransferase [Clostridium butyricum]